MISGTLMFLAFFWGLLLAVFYFGGLWLTVRHLPRRASRHGIWLFSSFFLRVLPVLAGMGIVLKLNPMAFFITLGSFFIVRPVLVRTLGRV